MDDGNVRKTKADVVFVSQATGLGKINVQLTKYTDISLRVLMHLASFPEGLGTVKDIAQRYRISRHHLVKVVHQLGSLGFLHSIQGRGGGVSLAMAPKDIIVGEVVRKMEATLTIIDCAEANCPLLPSCLLNEALEEAMSRFLDTLDNYTIADLTKNRAEIIRLIG
jgi:Rrf2 family nitric oxide-sensitive transcriptional repressor